MRISEWSSDVCSSDLFAHPHEIGELEAALERARCDAAIEQLARIALADRRLAAADGQHILLRGDVDLVRLEAGDRHRDAEMVVGDLLDVERRIIFGARPAGFESSEERRVGKERVSTCRSRWVPYLSQKNNTTTPHIQKQTNY